MKQHSQERKMSCQKAKIIFPTGKIFFPNEENKNTISNDWLQIKTTSYNNINASEKKEFFLSKKIEKKFFNPIFILSFAAEWRFFKNGSHS